MSLKVRFLKTIKSATKMFLFLFFVIVLITGIYIWRYGFYFPGHICGACELLIAQFDNGSGVIKWFFDPESLSNKSFYVCVKIPSLLKETETCFDKYESDHKKAICSADDVVYVYISIKGSDGCVYKMEWNTIDNGNAVCYYDNYGFAEFELPEPIKTEWQIEVVRKKKEPLLVSIGYPTSSYAAYKLVSPHKRK